MADDMKMINFMEAGYRAETERQKAIANNVANMNTPGYRRADVRFSDILEDSIERGKKSNLNDLKSEFYLPMNTPVDENKNDVSMNSEVGAMVENSLKHKTYMLLLKKRYQQLDQAMKTNG
jgi:flagellar basal-body rod protein FlgB